jgi:hypothetical protein
MATHPNRERIHVRQIRLDPRRCLALMWTWGRGGLIIMALVSLRRVSASYFCGVGDGHTVPRGAKMSQSVSSFVVGPSSLADTSIPCHRYDQNFVSRVLQVARGLGRRG